MSKLVQNRVRHLARRTPTKDSDVVALGGVFVLAGYALPGLRLRREVGLGRPPDGHGLSDTEDVDRTPDCARVDPFRDRERRWQGATSAPCRTCCCRLPALVVIGVASKLARRDRIASVVTLDEIEELLPRHRL